MINHAHPPNLPAISYAWSLNLIHVDSDTGEHQLWINHDGAWERSRAWFSGSDGLVDRALVVVYDVGDDLRAFPDGVELVDPEVRACVATFAGF